MTKKKIAQHIENILPHFLFMFLMNSWRNINTRKLYIIVQKKYIYVRNILMTNKRIKNINNQLTHYDFIDCPLCGESYKNTRTLFKKDHWLIDHKRICKKCWLIYQSPRWTEEDTNRFYNEFYLNDYIWRNSEWDKKHFDAGLSRKDEINIFYNEIKKAKNPIEIGCSSGGVLRALSDINDKFYGIDIDGGAIEFAKKQWLNAEKEDIFKLKDNIYDFVIMSHVVEHLLHPDIFIKKVHDILVEWWLFLIFVPDSYKCCEWPHVPHTFYFTEETLISMVTKQWFIIKNNIQWKNRPKKFKKDIIILFQKEKDSKQQKSRYNWWEFSLLKIKLPIVRIIIKILEATKTKNIIKRILYKT